MAGKNRVRLARVYTDPEPDEGKRVLVDRLWPRGMKKSDPRVGQWLPAVAPSTELRHWYDHKPQRYDDFAARYTQELQSGEEAAAFDELRALVKAGPVTLVTATREVELSHLTVLAELLA
ncbi:DUF488 domain-containing protein [Mycolicibacterium fortuitum]|jgi:uncharacterized protein YeaO (DUF488 family)|uniref:Conserved protein of uncharacterized function (Part2) n=3 Tax=Mycolicibacterium fortuitum TaxID=1766 RepID=A0A378U8T4_MYCFO|nr:DUF488 family protein [Mycolicibacterium fortuitum]AIY45899.1 putative uroporphyrin-III c-methyltransferase [Mycobacterium sp. VKM Ac-1817D]CRL76354.1 hypothetical protein CPGR_01630 [Mycolicibacter nonchromogenicus]AMD54495.1 hypothetical protein ATO49_09915 [Mycolicibacterium fortuitum subsp. fortuitum DSM 46621 = ATCC 6841 = JCM 6387]EJZ15097.1 hypothetical protein MFORT_06234 [Mycolicibacterium fortuitum subsp. fortuitum DSM 46621 = ATCC 6841 = JCM 6387]MCA4722245.1 DUF488 family protei